MDLEADLSALPCSWIRSTDVGHSHKSWGYSEDGDAIQPWPGLKLTLHQQSKGCSRRAGRDRGWCCATGRGNRHRLTQAQSCSPLGSPQGLQPRKGGSSASELGWCRSDLHPRVCGKTLERCWHPYLSVLCGGTEEKRLSTKDKTSRTKTLK